MYLDFTKLKKRDLLILLAILLLAILGILAYKHFTDKGTKSVLTGELEGFQPAPIQTAVLTDTSKSFKQLANLIGTNNITQISDNIEITGNAEIRYKSTITLPDTFIISQLLLTNVIKFGLLPLTKIRISVKNSKLNTINYVSFTDLIQTGMLDADSLDYVKKTTQNISKSGNTLYLNQPKNIYGNELIGNEITIYSGAPINTAELIFGIFGFLEKEKYKPLYYDKAKPIPVIRGTASSEPVAGTIQVVSNPGDLKGFGSTVSPVPPVVIYSMTLKYITPVTTTSSETTTTTASETTTTSSETTTTKPVTTTSGETTTTVTSVEPFQESTSARVESRLFKLLFKNNYTNDTITYPGPLDGKFIFAGPETVLRFTSTLLASQLTLVFDNNPTFMHNIVISDVAGYTATVDDINRFRLEYSITDIRGSINPDDVCPSLDRFVENQLNSEVIIDAMDYQDKINGEKAKLLSNKDNLLTLLEQQADIDKLSQVVKKIKNVQQRRTDETNALNAIQLQRQMNEYSALKEVLDDRVALRKRNTANVDINVNTVKYVEGFSDNIQGFREFKPEDDMALRIHY